MMKKVHFKSGKSTLTGDLYIPEQLNAPVPAVVIIGPMTYVKEQAPTNYAKRLATQGFIALAFDCRYRGESGGEPRAYENPLHKVEDIKAAVNFLASYPDVDSDKIAGLGICQGSSEMLRAIAEEPRIKVGATIAGQYRDREGSIEWLGEDGYQKRLEAGKKAKQKYEQTGEVEYIPAVDEENMEVGMPGKMVWDWYHHWSDRGVWENFYAVMSDAELLPYESISAAQQMQTPYLMIHSDNCMQPAAARRHYEAMPTSDKKLLWQGETMHLQFYDDPKIVSSAVVNVADWFEKHLSQKVPTHSM